jgi:hypothetical protein
MTVIERHVARRQVDVEDTKLRAFERRAVPRLLAQGNLCMDEGSGGEKEESGEAWGSHDLE